MNTDLTTLAAVILKIFTLLGLGLYGVFAIIIIRQEQLMSHVLEEAFEPVLRALVLVHLIGAIALFFLAVVLL